ncbi:DUF4304 domain-containing protein [Massilia dura]|uniref:DUF4304 domain-containing protein n=1 Tax=Pseudoduganella dura TaxID=321982 RepID=A0A6I3XFJ9_9BURK|nr:DUF4304 domain-containing protein [Pseudoduganella dura]MUI15724.1 DUF4304 domain-containing protein [Pseudoduganella dura]GGX88915.1 hypothetical protein GCM10007386_19620 [Pseudoduganella dura]
MNAAKNYKSFKRYLAKRLAPEGYVGNGNALTLKVSEAVIVFELQQDLKNSSKEMVRFTVNTGISLHALREFFSDDSSESVFSAEQCHWRSRLGRLMDSPSDVWWTISNDEDVESRCDEIVSIIRDIALPQIKTLAVAETFVQLWKNGKGQGLTEYERRISLARLLWALGRETEAQGALEAFETASIGKGWAASAKVDARELKKHFE